MIIAPLDEYLARIAPHLPISEVLVFGSWAQETADADSDVDVYIFTEAVEDDPVSILGAQGIPRRSDKVDAIFLPETDIRSELAAGRTILYTALRYGSTYPGVRPSKYAERVSAYDRLNAVQYALATAQSLAQRQSDDARRGTVDQARYNAQRSVDYLAAAAAIACRLDPSWKWNGNAERTLREIERLAHDTRIANFLEEVRALEESLDHLALEIGGGLYGEIERLSAEVRGLGERSTGSP